MNRTASRSKGERGSPRLAPSQQRRQGRRFPLGWRFAVACFVYHFLMAVTIRSAEAPDEWWQSAEVAYYLVFHKGTPTWEWRQGIRSVFFPSLFAVGFKLLQMLRLDSPRALYLSERITQALILTAIHVTMCYLSQRLECSLDDEVGPAEPTSRSEGQRSTGLLRAVQDFFLSPSLVATVARLGCVQWYFIYAGVRAYSNVTEALFFLLALVPRSLPWFLVWAGLACMTRVTAAISLMPVFVDHFVRIVRERGAVRGSAYTITVSCVMLGVIGALVVSVDYLFYKRIVLTPYEFIKSNIGDDVSRLFGEHASYWYFLLAVPLMANLHYILAFAAPLVVRRIHAGPRTRHDVNLYLACLVWTLAVHSFVAHKEMRFVYSQVPVAMLLGAFVSVCAVRYPSRILGITSAANAHHPQARSSKRQLVPSLLRLVYLGSVVLNLVLLFVGGFFVREGCLDIMATVRNGPYHYNRLDVVTHCYFLPGYSQVHGKVDTLSVVDCPVVLDSQGRPKPTDDMLLRQDERRFLWWKYARKEIPAGSDEDADAIDQWYRTARLILPVAEGPSPLPDGLIAFKELTDAVESSFLAPHGYSLVRRVHHTTFVENEGSHVDLWRRTNASKS